NNTGWLIRLELHALTCTLQSQRERNRIKTDGILEEQVVIWRDYKVVDESEARNTSRLTPQKFTCWVEFVEGNRARKPWFNSKVNQTGYTIRLTAGVDPRMGSKGVTLLQNTIQVVFA